MHYDRNSLVVVKTTAYEINYYMNRGLLDITLCDKSLSGTCGRSMVYAY